MKEKIYGKAKVYWIDQGQFGAQDPAALASTEARIGELTREIKANEEVLRKAEGELRILKASLSTKEAKEQLAEVIHSHVFRYTTSRLNGPVTDEQGENPVGEKAGGNFRQQGAGLGGGLQEGRASQDQTRLRVAQEEAHVQRHAGGHSGGLPQDQEGPPGRHWYRSGRGRGCQDASLMQ